MDLKELDIPVNSNDVIIGEETNIVPEEETAEERKERLEKQKQAIIEYVDGLSNDQVANEINTIFFYLKGKFMQRWKKMQETATQLHIAIGKVFGFPFLNPEDELFWKTNSFQDGYPGDQKSVLRSLKKSTNAFRRMGLSQDIELWIRDINAELSYVSGLSYSVSKSYSYEKTRKGLISGKIYTI